jgi:hypothetical protein
MLIGQKSKSKKIQTTKGDNRMEKLFNTKYVVITSEDDFKLTGKTDYIYMSLDVVHPARQLNLLLSMIESGTEKLIWHTNSEVTIQHINNMIMMGRDKNKKLSEEMGYNGFYIDSEDISMFEYTKENDKMVELKEGKLAYEIPWMTKYLTSFFEKTVIITEKYDIPE